MAKKKKAKKKRARKKNQRKPAIAAAPKPPDNHDIVYRAEELAAIGQGEKAISLLQKTLQHQPDNVEAIKVLAIIHMKRHSYQQAAEVFGKLADLQPDDASTLNARGTALTLAGQGPEAYHALKAAVDLQPENPLYLANLGKLCMLSSNWYMAAAYLERALAAAPENQRSKYADALHQCQEQMEQSQPNARIVSSEGLASPETPVSSWDDQTFSDSSSPMF